MNKVEYSIWQAKQHIKVARESIEKGVEDLVGYSIRAAEKRLKEAEDRLKEVQEKETKMLPYIECLCGRRASLIGVTEKREIKYHCPGCYKVTIVRVT